jgi:DNA mismatch repair protein MutS
LKSTGKKAKKETPLMRQYYEVKAQHPDALLLFRVGDFYETFGEDAVTSSQILGIVLTSRNNGGNDVELAGFPHHSLDVYLPKLVRAGYRVAICEQLEKPSKEKKIVKRGISELVTPGVAFSDELLDHKKNNFLCAIHRISDTKIGVAFTDVSTGEFLVSQGVENEIFRLIRQLRPSEILASRDQVKYLETALGPDFFYYQLEPWVFTEEHAIEKLKRHFEVSGLKGFGIDNLIEAQIAGGSVIEYLGQTHNEGLLHINKVQRIHTEESVWLDDFTVRNLELVNGQFPTSKTLKGVLDRTVTPMGARTLEKWILFPLIEVQSIQKRQNLVEFFYEKDIRREEVTQRLKRIGDLERLSSRIPLSRINPREISQLGRSLLQIQEVITELKSSGNQIVSELAESLLTCDAVTEKIDTAISDEPPVNISKGHFIRDGYNATLDDLRNTVKHSKDLLADIQQIEAEKTGITNLKIGYNNVFGYFLEVTNKYKDKGLVPDHWVRKQTLTNAERYITDDLKALEEKILGAEDKIQELEESLLEEVIRFLKDHITAFQQNAQVIGALDVSISLANVALHQNYVKPLVNDSRIIDIRAGRHPVIEYTLPPSDSYIANDVLLDPDATQIMMITGPNMSGKSAILRQTALIVLMAQIGSFVPAKEAEIGVVDKVFTRVGASDNISSGESTFMVEMNETASIMNNLSDRSLILLDEIGRGTSTFDGISIAWALAEFLHNHKNYHPKTLFATHYHELNELASEYERIRNFNIATKQAGHKVIFLRKLVEGGSEHSFGIHVAKMAGMPVNIVKRAEEILKVMEQNAMGREKGGIPAPDPNLQLSFFDTQSASLKEMRNSISEIDLNTMTPIEALLKLAELKKQIEADSQD